MVAILSDQREVILGAVREMYTQVATAPEKGFHFPTGPGACRLLSYPEELLGVLPNIAKESFAGVGYPFAAEVIREGDTVLDVGSGSGTDTLTAGRLVGPSGRVIGMDLTPAMLEKLSRSAAAAGIQNIEPLAGNAEQIPLPDASVDAVTSNGVLNLVPDKRRAFDELFRVLQPGGRMQIADIALRSDPSDECRANPNLWAECVVGATTEVDYVALLEEAGFADIEILSRFDYFAASPSESTRNVAEQFGAFALVLRASKPGVPDEPTSTG